MNDVEMMVNNSSDMRSFARERAAAKKRELRLKRMLMSVGVLAVIALTTMLFGAIGAVHNFLATAIAVVSTMSGCFVLGQYAEAVLRK